MSDNKFVASARVDELNPGLNFGRLAVRQLLPIAVVLLGVWLVRDRILALDFQMIRSVFRDVSVTQWIGAALATAASFWAIGRYDAVLHGLLGTGISTKSARTSGALAIAVAQFTGLGVITGAIVRWRMLPQASLWLAGRITLAVAVSFLAGWAVFSAIVVLATGAPFAGANVAAMWVLSGALTLVILSTFQPSFLPKLPPVRAMAAILILTALDTIFAGVAFWVLLPDTIDVPVALFFAAFLLALGAGLMGGTPGGIGPFEFTLLGLLPQLPAEQLLACAFAFRIVYHLLPAAIAVLVVLRGTAPAGAPNPATIDMPKNLNFLDSRGGKVIWQAARAETNLLRQGELGMLAHHHNPLAIAGLAGQSLVMVGDPLAPSQTTALALQTLSRAAAYTYSRPVVYKCCARVALAARKAGWCVAIVAKEAWVDPKTYSPTGTAGRQLRRMLRKAEADDVIVTQAGKNLPFDQMDTIARDWARKQGGERGFSMGRFDRDYICHQRVFLAWQKDQLIAFLTLSEVEGEWTLDLMRKIETAPAGTMHLLMYNAILAAARAECPRVSLAAVPDFATTNSPTMRRLRYLFDQRAGTDGLTRFKSCFAPNWEQLYAAAPTRLGLGVGLWDVMRAVHRANRPNRPKRVGHAKRPGRLKNKFHA